MSPYFGKDFFAFFPLFFSRLFQLLTGQLAWGDLASDEVQVLVLSCICIASALVGTLLVLKKMTMLANSLSHTILLGIVTSTLLLSSTGALAMSLPALLVSALITGVVTTVLTLACNRLVREDASIALVFTSLFALGILLVTLYTRNTHIEVDVVMGNVDALHVHDLRLAFWVVAFVAICVALFFKEWKLLCFDPLLGKSLGFRPGIFQLFLMFLTSCTAISAFRAVGALLFLAFLVGLPLSARLFTADLRQLLFVAMGLGTGCSLVAVALSRHFLTVYHTPLSTSGLTVTLIGAVFGLSVAIRHWFLKPIKT